MSLISRFLESLYLLKKEIKKSDRIKSVQVCWQIVAIILKKMSVSTKTKPNCSLKGRAGDTSTIYLLGTLTCEVSDIAVAPTDPQP